MSFALVLPFNHYWAPFFLERISQIGMIGIWVPMYSALALSGLLIRHVNWFAGHEHRGILIAIVMTGLGLMFLGMTLGVVLPLACAMLHEGGRGFFQPLLETFTQKHVESAYRATYVPCVH